MNTINTFEAKTSLSRLLSTVEKKGVTITICRYGKPVADLCPHHHQKRRRNLTPPPSLKGKILGDITKPLSKKDWPEIFRQ
jgi:antitoxin (DNA-binding transcriptional repressor) of toxin-antitoxin stability system